ncbi:major capsid protein [Pokkaliibacter sp. CJK22405]|uniref:major capsid protein n=1 Tax=Pokkaliibacter sp. CJK22405 TaxID=3384615 RepID=UPI0039853B3F
MSDRLTTEELLEVRKNFRIDFAPVMLQRFFPNIFTSQSKFVVFEEINEDVPMAPLVLPLINGKPDKNEGFEATKLEPAYVKSTHKIDPEQSTQRLPGEALGGSLDPVTRLAMIRADSLQKEEKAILQRLEKIATDVLYDGSCTLVGDDYPARLIDYNRRAENTIKLSGIDKWSAMDKATYDPTEDLEEWASNCQGIASDFIFDKKSWALFISFKAVKEKRDTTQRGETTSIQTGPTIKRGAAEKAMQYKGTFGEFNLWLFAGEVMQADRSTLSLARENTILITPSSGDGSQAYGAIRDAKANAAGVISVSRYPKNWFSDGDVSEEWIQTQCAPLLVPDNPNNVVAVTVD